VFHSIKVGLMVVFPAMGASSIQAPRFRPEDYNLLWHNCNHFSHEFCQLLTGEGLPDYILNQAQVLFNTPWGESLMPMIMAMEGFTGRATSTGLASPGAAAYAPAAAEARPSGASTSSSSAAAAVKQADPEQQSHKSHASGGPAIAAAANSAAEAAAEAAHQVVDNDAANKSSSEAPTEQQKDVASDNGGGGGCDEGVVFSTAVKQRNQLVPVQGAADKVSDEMTVLQLTADSRAAQEH
jgi:hypothetical protein